jgi:hypothetical protein
MGIVMFVSLRAGRNAAIARPSAVVWNGSLVRVATRNPRTVTAETARPAQRVRG